MTETMAARATRILKDFLIAGIIIGGGIYLLIAIGSTSPARPSLPPAAPSASPAPVGTERHVSNGNSTIPIAIDPEALPDLANPSANPETHGRIFVVADQTRVRISEASASAPRVKVLTGPQKGRLGWVPLAWLQP